MANILIVYGATRHPLRATNWSHLYSFRRYSGHYCYYLNMLYPWKLYKNVPWYIKQIKFDLIIFHTTFMASIRTIPHSVERLKKQAGILKQASAVKIALPQDEYHNPKALNLFINEFNIDYLFSVAPEAEWPKLYSNVNFDNVKFTKILTGYLDEDVLTKINELRHLVPSRSIDIGYRAFGIRHMLGRHGLLKIEIAHLFKHAAKDLVLDISTSLEDTFYGDEWYKFLLRCKYTVGVEGGASVLDWDGSLRMETEAYIRQHPQASFEEVEAACFPECDGKLDLMAISPRHLEACATKTCQVLVEGDYNGILSPGQHYIELKRDFSNIDDVINIVKQDHRRAEITERAYHDIVESGQYTYHGFVKTILDKTLGPTDTSQKSAVLFWHWVIYKWTYFTDVLSWRVLATITPLVNALMATSLTGIIRRYRWHQARRS